jgi:hypothetical protein
MPDDFMIIGQENAELLQEVVWLMRAFDCQLKT